MSAAPHSNRLTGQFEVDPSRARKENARTLASALYWTIQDEHEGRYVPTYEFLREQRPVIERYLTSVIVTALTVPRGQRFTLVNVHTEGRRPGETAIHTVAVVWRGAATFVIDWAVTFAAPNQKDTA